MLEKLKGKLVVLGNLQESENNKSLRTPTPSITTVMVKAGRAAAVLVITFDIS